MLTLSKDFQIVSIEKSHDSLKRLEQSKIYTFLNNNKQLKIKLEIEYSIIGYTKKTNSAIINFGYTVDIEKYNKKKIRWEYLYIDNESGKDTKEYFSDKMARSLIVKFIKRNMTQYIKRIEPYILFRGAFNEIKPTLKRYKDIDNIIIENGYLKKELLVKENDKLYKKSYNLNVDNVIMWLYSKDKKVLKEIKEGCFY
jgi:hypothetical protein